MRFGRYFALLVQLLVLCGGAAAQQNPLSTREIAALKVEMAESNYKLVQNLRTLARLITAYEEAVGAFCLSDLSAGMQAAGSPSSAECKTFVEKTLSLAPDDPVAICGRDGIEAQSCMSASAQQLTLQYVPQTESPLVSRPDALDATLRLQKAGEIRKQLRSRLQSAQTQYRANPKPVLQNMIRGILSQWIDLDCSDALIALAPAGGSGSSSTDSNNYSARRDGLFDRPSGSILPDDKPKPTAPQSSSTERIVPFFQEKISRVRYISTTCQAALQGAASADPTFSGIICGREGPFDPRCISAKRRETSMNTNTPSRPRSDVSAPGIGRF